MRAIVQRVSKASVSVNSECVSEIKSGILALIGIESADTKEDVSVHSDAGAPEHEPIPAPTGRSGFLKAKR